MSSADALKTIQLPDLEGDEWNDFLKKANKHDDFNSFDGNFVPFPKSDSTVSLTCLKAGVGICPVHLFLEVPSGATNEEMTLCDHIFLVESKDARGKATHFLFDGGMRRTDDPKLHPTIAKMIQTYVFTSLKGSDRLVEEAGVPLKDLETVILRYEPYGSSIRLTLRSATRISSELASMCIKLVDIL